MRFSTLCVYLEKSSQDPIRGTLKWSQFLQRYLNNLVLNILKSIQGYTVPLMEEEAVGWEKTSRLKSEKWQKQNSGWGTFSEKINWNITTYRAL